MFRSFRASAHTGVGIPRIETTKNIASKPGDRQEVNCPQGKRDHPGVHHLSGLVRDDQSIVGK